MVEEIMTPKAFAEAANPHAWFLSADDLHGQAARLRSYWGKEYRKTVDSEGHVLGDWDANNRGVLLLGGLALENIIKGFLVYEHPSWISNGKLARELRSHKLVELKKLSNRLPRSDRSLQVLRQFQTGSESWMRYPCALTAAETKNEAAMPDLLWSDYCELIGSFARGLAQMLSDSVWRGPHGVKCRYYTHGTYCGTRIDVGPSYEQFTRDKDA